MINTGLSQAQCKTISEQLTQLLADTYMLYLKTQNCHWNVKGPMFHSLHELFEEQYTALAEAIDEIAERIRALGQYATGSYAQYSKLSRIKEISKQLTDEEMLEQLLADNEALAKILRDMQAACSDDDVSVDLCIGRIAYHEKTAWMLRSLLSR